MAAYRDDGPMTRNNLVYLAIGALCVGVAVLGYQLYQERQKPGLSPSASAARTG